MPKQRSVARHRFPSGSAASRWNAGVDPCGPATALFANVFDECLASAGLACGLRTRDGRDQDCYPSKTGAAKLSPRRVEETPMGNRSKLEPTLAALVDPAIPQSAPAGEVLNVLVKFTGAAE